MAVMISAFIVKPIILYGLPVLWVGMSLYGNDVF